MLAHGRAPCSLCTYACSENGSGQLQGLGLVQKDELVKMVRPMLVLCTHAHAFSVAACAVHACIISVAVVIITRVSGRWAVDPGA